MFSSRPSNIFIGSSLGLKSISLPLSTRASSGRVLSFSEADSLPLPGGQEGSLLCGSSVGEGGG